MAAIMQPDLVCRHRLTVEEYLRMTEVGLLTPEARVELIEGEIIDMAPTGPQHGSLMWGLLRRIARDLGDRVWVWDQATLPLDRFSAPQPDIAVLKYRMDEYAQYLPSPSDVLLIVEVSQSSLHHDQKVKLPLYARHGVPEVWIVDIERQRIHFFHSLQDGHYTHISSTPTPGRVSLHSRFDFAIDLTGLLEHL